MVSLYTFHLLCLLCDVSVSVSLDTVQRKLKLSGTAQLHGNRTSKRIPENANVIQIFG